VGGSSLHDGTTRIPALDGIRGLAIGLVLAWHGVFNVLVHIPNHPQAARILALGRLTWSGVDLCFVLSGFLIGGILLDAAKAERYFALLHTHLRTAKNRSIQKKMMPMSQVG
jgi:peptidoglycan/LPS O-acetylase OafA/YrhL